MHSKHQPKTEAFQIILDSNSLFVPLQFNIDIFEGIDKLLNRKYELIVISSIRQELEKMSKKGSPKMRRNASFALRLAKRCKMVKDFGEDHSEIPPDDIILRVANEGNCAVFTNDRELRKRLRDINVPVIYVRGKTRLEIDGRI